MKGKFVLYQPFIPGMNVTQMQIVYMIYSLLQHIQQPGSQTFKEAIMSRLFAGSRSNTLPDDQTQIFSGEPSQDQPNRRHVHVVILGTGYSGLGMALQRTQEWY